MPNSTPTHMYEVRVLDRTGSSPVGNYVDRDEAIEAALSVDPKFDPELGEGHQYNPVYKVYDEQAFWTIHELGPA